VSVLLLPGAVSGCAADRTASDASTASADAITGARGAGPSGGAGPAAVVCAKDAKAVVVPKEFPAGATLPQGYVVTNVEVRSGSRIVVTAVSPKEFRTTLSDMQRIFSANGWTMSQGEGEADDAESNFSGNGVTGRWALRGIDQCQGNTSVSLVTGPAAPGPSALVSS